MGARFTIVAAACYLPRPRFDSTGQAQEIDMSSSSTTDTLDLAGRRVWVAGHRGMVGRAIVRRLAQENCQILTVGRDSIDLRRQAEVEAWVDQNRPDVIFMAAATVGGIMANSQYPANFLYDNLAIEMNITQAAYKSGVSKYVFLGSSCIYPKFAPQPMTEDSLLSGPLEPTNQWYAVAKIAGIKLCQAYRQQYGCNFISAMPTNLYGPFDNYDLGTSHVVPALIAKIHQAKLAGADTVTLWGTGQPMREFLHVDDLADAVVFLARTYSGAEHVNVGTGTDVRIVEMATMLAEVIGWQGQFVFDTSKPDGTPRKLMDVSRLTGLGWQARISLFDGLTDAYRWYLENVETGVRQVAYQSA
jgi:GDP-L-fucose synthase